MSRSTAPTAESPEVEGPCDVGECESCGTQVLVTDDGETDSLNLYGPRKSCECGSSRFRRVSVDEALG